MIQGSKEWHEHRRAHNNASEAGAVMEVNPWFPKNQAELFDLKTGAREVFVNPAMTRGTEMEPLARQWLQAHMGGEVFTPVVITNGRYSASLDGINFDGDIACEIKCPGDTSKLWGVETLDQLKTVAPYYFWQIVHQFYAATAVKQMVFVVFSESKANVVNIERDEISSSFDALVQGWTKFNQALDSVNRPDDGDDESEELGQLISGYRKQKAICEAAEAMLEAIKIQLVEYAKTTNKKAVKGYGGSITQVVRKGTIDYGKIPELKNVDIEKYRKKDSMYWKVDV